MKKFLNKERVNSIELIDLEIKQHQLSANIAQVARTHMIGKLTESVEADSTPEESNAGDALTE